MALDEMQEMLVLLRNIEGAVDYAVKHPQLAKQDLRTALTLIRVVRDSIAKATQETP